MRARLASAVEAGRITTGRADFTDCGVVVVGWFFLTKKDAKQDVHLLQSN
jgi:hypothetical protein